MSATIRQMAYLALGLGMASISNAAIGDSGSGSTTRYWDCCKGSCSWPDKAPVDSPVKTCSKDDSPLSDANTASACDGGEAYMCSDQSPWVEGDQAYGFGAVSIPGGSEDSWCCACYELTFTSGAVKGKKMTIQATNTGADLAEGQFDLAIPGGGVGIYNACTAQWGAPSNGWGAQYGGISTDTCSSFPSALQSSCEFRFGDFFQGADNPTVDWKQVSCPAALTEKTGCTRTDDNGGSNGGSGSGHAVSSSSAPAASSSSSSNAVVAPASSSTSEAASSNYGTTTANGAVTYSSAAAPSSSATGAVGGGNGAPYGSGAAPSGTAPSGGLPSVGPTGSGSVPVPSGGSGDGEQCVIEYVYV